MSTKNIQCKKRKIVVWIISIGIIAALFFGISKFISYRTMPPFAAEREALEIDYGDYLEIDGFKLWFELLNEDCIKNYVLSIKMAVTYFILSKLKLICPLYYQAFVEIFIVRGMLCGYAIKNLTAGTKLITIIEALEKVKLTDYILIPIISFIRLFLEMRNDFSIAYMSLKTRKLIKNKNPAAIWRFIIVPVVFSLIRSAENLSLGIETKGMIIGKERTLLTDVNFKITDYILSAMYMLVYTFLITGGIKWIIN